MKQQRGFVLVNALVIVAALAAAAVFMLGRAEEARVRAEVAVEAAQLGLNLDAFETLAKVMLAIERATREGTSLVFGFLGGGPAPFELSAPEHSFVLAFRALPLILTFSVLAAVLWHWRVIPWLIRGIAWLWSSGVSFS